jgi:Tol biopolymer transport system component
VYSAAGDGDLDDLYRMDSNGQNNRPLTNTPAISERRPRIDPTGNVAVFERIDAGAAGEVWIFNTSTSQVRVTQGGPPGDALPGTPYRIGSDADPDYSPDGRAIVFRRLTAAGSDGRGAWDLLTVAIDGSGLRVIATGARYRGAPDWGPQGIAFEELDEDGRASLVLLSPDGVSRQTLAALGAGSSLSFPRWLP